MHVPACSKRVIWNFAPSSDARYLMVRKPSPLALISVDDKPLRSLSPQTVETYRARMMQKLGIGDFATLIRFAIQQGVSPLE